MKFSRLAVQESGLVAPSNLPALFILCVVVMTVALPEFTRAQEWRIEPVIRVGGEFDDNATLATRTDLEQELSGLLLDLRADISYSSSRTSFTVQPWVRSRNYDESDFDSDDFFLRSNLNYRGQLSSLGFKVFYEEQAVRTAERADSDLEIEDPDDLTEDDTGRVVRFGDRSKWRFLPNWEYQLSNTSSVGVQVDYYDVQYEDIIPGSYDDYTDTRLNLNYRRNFSDVNTGLLTVTARKYDAENVESDTDGYGIMAGFEYALSQKMRLRAMIGLEDSDQSGFDNDPEATANVTLTRNLETIRMFAQYRRSVNGSGAGGLSVRDSLNVSFRRRLNEKISAGLGIRAYQTNSVDGSTSDDGRDYIQLHSSFLWYLSPAFVIEADYRYTVNDGADNAERANSNQVNLWFTYQPRTVPKI